MNKPDKPAYFTRSVIQTKNKFVLLAKFLFRVIRGNLLWTACTVLVAFFTALFYFNVRVNLRQFSLSSSEQEVKAIDQRLETDFDSFSSDGLNIETQKEELLRTARKTVKTVHNDKGDYLKKKDYVFSLQFPPGLRFTKTDLSAGKFLLLLVIFGVLIRSCLGVANYCCLRIFSRVAEKKLKGDLLAVFLAADYEDSSQISRNMQNYFSSDIEDVSWSIIMIPLRLIYVLFSITFVLAFEFSFGPDAGKMNWPVLGVFAFLIFNLFAVFLLTFRRANKLKMKIRQEIIEDNKLVYESIDNLEYIKITAAEEEEKRRFEEIFENSFKRARGATLKSTIYTAAPSWFINTNITIFFAVLLFLLGSSGIISRSNTVFTFFYFLQFYESVKVLNSEIGKITDLLIELDVLTTGAGVIFNSLRKVVKKEEKRDLLPFIPGNVVFENVFFSYPDNKKHKILRGMNFTFERGKVYGVFGKNGMGKTTITKTLIKLFAIDGGDIKIGANSIHQIDAASLRRNLCYQTNRPAFLSMTLAENIYYPKRPPLNYKEELNRIAKKTETEELVSKLPNGFDTILRITAPGSISLSEGQKQQVAMMRLFIRKYDIYVFDEALNNVAVDLKQRILKRAFSHVRSSPAIAIIIDHHHEVFSHTDEVYEFTREELLRINRDDIVNKAKAKNKE